MEKLPEQENTKKTQDDLERFLRSYEIQESDISSLSEKIEIVVGSDLLKQETLAGLRVVTFDSGNLYIFSREPHISTERFKVEDLGEKSPSGFHCYKIPSTSLGSDISHYGGAWGSIELPEIASTITGSSDIGQNSKNKNPKAILIAPETAYKRTPKGTYDYLTDLLAHEFGHVEEMSVKEYQDKEGQDAFEGEESRRKFSKVVGDAIFVPEWLREKLLSKLDRETIGEMYAMLVDGEAKKRFRKELYNEGEGAFLEEIRNMVKEEVDPMLKWEHGRGYTLARILEAQIPDYSARKQFVLDLLAREEEKKQETL